MKNELERLMREKLYLQQMLSVMNGLVENLEEIQRILEEGLSHENMSRKPE